MKELSLKFCTAIACLALFSAAGFAQTYKTNWSVYAGASYPRFIDSDLPAIASNYGAFTAVQYNFNEYIGFKLKLGYNDFGFQGDKHTKAITQNVTMVYSILPYEDIFPFITVGGGGISYDSPKSSGNFVYQINAGIGSEVKLGNKFSIAAELSYNKTNDDGFDGVYDDIYQSGSSDDYLAFDLSGRYMFSVGKKVEKYTPLRSGLSEADFKRYIVDSISAAKSVEDDAKYKRILDMLENIVQRTVPQQETAQPAAFDTTGGLASNNIESVLPDSAALAETKEVIESTIIIFSQGTQLELSSYLELDKVGQLLLKYPSIKIEVKGFANYSTKEELNKQLSQDRADYIKDFINKMGIDSGRMSSAGYGSDSESNKSGKFSSVEFVVTD